MTLVECLRCGAVPPVGRVPRVLASLDPAHACKPTTSGKWIGPFDDGYVRFGFYACPNPECHRALRDRARAWLVERSAR